MGRTARKGEFNKWNRKNDGAIKTDNCKVVEIRPWSEGERKLREAEEILSLPDGTRLFAETAGSPRRLFFIDLVSLKKILNDWKENPLFRL